MQFMPDTARAYGVNPHNEASAVSGAARYLAQLSQQFGGDKAKAVAAYNMGAGALAKVIAQWGADWASHLPAETTHYLAEVL
jgi:soluble lytic murein transglycosylase-like protein